MPCFRVSLPIVGRMEVVVEAKNAEAASAAAWDLYEEHGEDAFEDIEYDAKTVLLTEAVTPASLEVGAPFDCTELEDIERPLVDWQDRP